MQHALSPSLVSLAGGQNLVITAEMLSQLQQSQQMQQQQQQQLILADSVSSSRTSTVVATTTTGPESTSSDFHFSAPSPELRIASNVHGLQVFSVLPFKAQFVRQSQLNYNCHLFVIMSND